MARAGAGSTNLLSSNDSSCCDDEDATGDLPFAAGFDDKTKDYNTSSPAEEQVLTLDLTGGEFADSLTTSRSLKRIQEVFGIKCERLGNDTPGVNPQATNGAGVVKLKVKPLTKKADVAKLRTFLDNGAKSTAQYEPDFTRQCFDVDVIPILIREIKKCFVILGPRKSGRYWMLDSDGHDFQDTESVFKFARFLFKNKVSVEFSDTRTVDILTRTNFLRYEIFKKTEVRLSVRPKKSPEQSPEQSPEENLCYFVPTTEDAKKNVDAARRLVNFGANALFCGSFDRFRAKLRLTNTTFECAAGRISNESEQMVEQLWIAAITQLNVAWEAFCVDVLRELFVLMREIDEGGWDEDQSTSKRYEKWPKFEKIVWETFKLDTKFTPGITEESVRIDAKALLESHLKHLGGCIPSSPTVESVLKFWYGLFLCETRDERRKVEDALEWGVKERELKLDLPDGKAVIIIVNFGAYKKLVRLAYGLRCLCAHGCPELTVEGSLAFINFSPADFEEYKSRKDAIAEATVAQAKDETNIAEAVAQDTNPAEPAVQRKVTTDDVARYLNDIRDHARDGSLKFDQKVFLLVDRIVYFSSRAMTLAVSKWGSDEVKSEISFPYQFWTRSLTGPFLGPLKSNLIPRTPSSKSAV